jgi:hypothetical protein
MLDAILEIIENAQMTDNTWQEAKAVKCEIKTQLTELLKNYVLCMWHDRDVTPPTPASNVLVYNGSVYMANISWDGHAMLSPGDPEDGIEIDYFNRWTHWMELPTPPNNRLEMTPKNGVKN